ncbi:MAG: helix-turn-helix domain-containing protein [Salinisphaeraceae bacterium]|nr:helix-turn-helix domain-containing protein [Salinisphaeraceae bacterium]
MLVDDYPKLTLEIMDMVGNKWTLLIVYILDEGPLRFSELRRAAAPISQKVLTQTLRALERHGMVTRTVLPESPPKVEYALTPLGASFLKAAAEVCKWTKSNIEQLELARNEYDQAREIHKAS